MFHSIAKGLTFIKRRYVVNPSARTFGLNTRNYSKALSELSFEELASSITPYEAQTLVQHGFVVIDNVLNDATCGVFAREIRLLQEAQKLRLNSTHLVKAGKRALLQKPGIYEAEVADTVTAQQDLLHPMIL